MNLLTRYLGREIYASIALVFAALILLFAFLDLIHEMNVMQGKYGLGYVLLFVVLTIPGHVYELFPVAVLIGTIVALVHLAANSELTVYRASGASLFDMLIALFKIGLPLVVLSFVFGELVAPPSERMAQKLRLKAQNTLVSVQTFRSGVWIKDEQSFVNIKNVLPENRLQDISIYQFDNTYHLNKITNAKEGKFVKPGVWMLTEVRETYFNGRGVTTRSSLSEAWRSSINPSILSVLLVVPEQMSASDLREYASHLRDNHQQSARYEIAMWNKLVYPFAVLVMMVLALPFAGHQHRSGGISTKIFLGIVLGLAFHFIGRLFASIGALNNWQPFLSATAMTGLFLLMGLGMLWWTERR
jgi:lipopolysaccharide export system permease protein